MTTLHPNHQTRSILAAITFAILSLNYVAPIDPVLATSQEASGAPPVAAPQPNFKMDLGPISVEHYSNVSRYQNRLRLSKEFYKLVVRNNLKPATADPIHVHKTTVLTELVRCQNLTLARPEMEPMIACLPLEIYVNSLPELQQTVREPSSSLYALRWIIKWKSRNQLWPATFRGESQSSSGDHNSRRQIVVAYNLQPELVRQNIELSLNEHPASFNHFLDPLYSTLGLYIEWNHANLRLSCSGNIFVSLNDTGRWEAGQARPSDQSTDELLLAARQGALVSVPSFACKDSSNLVPLQFEMQLNVAYQQQFPYWSLKHRMSSEAIVKLWEYLGQIKQTRATDSAAKPDAYNTTISIDSQSNHFPNLRFNLEQDFVNEDGQTGHERMALVHARLAALVEGNWTQDSLVKALQVFDVAGGGAPGEPQANLKPLLMAAYENDPANGDEFVSVRLSLRRNLLDALLGRAPQASPIEAGAPGQHGHEEL